MLPRIVDALSAPELHDPQLVRVAALDPEVPLEPEAAEGRQDAQLELDGSADVPAWLQLLLAVIAGGILVRYCSAPLLHSSRSSTLTSTPLKRLEGYMPDLHLREHFRPQLDAAAEQVTRLTAELRHAQGQWRSAEQAAQLNHRMLLGASATAVLLGVAQLMMRAARH
uniref:Uncharacterized protein n=1 Tax=Haptolina ericina TaxID=156174 RepID=A0A7S3F2P3_9EUKA